MTHDTVEAESRELLAQAYRAGALAVHDHWCPNDPDPDFTEASYDYASSVVLDPPLQTGGEPVPMVLHCPACGLQHIDEATADWSNPPHRSHLCHGCGHIWRPADVATTGVKAVTTRGSADSALAPSTYAQVEGEPVGWLLRGEDGAREVIFDEHGARRAATEPGDTVTPLYASPPPAAGPTRDEINAALDAQYCEDGGECDHMWNGAVRSCRAAVLALFTPKLESPSLAAGEEKTPDAGAPGVPPI